MGISDGESWEKDNPQDKLSEKEKKEQDKLHARWATGRATRKQIERCMELDRKSGGGMYLKN